MAKYFYPAKFQEEEDGFAVSFPDLPGCFTEGDSLEDAYKMAVDAIGLYLVDTKKGASFPMGSSPKEIVLADNEFVALIEFDELIYRKKHESRAVKKTLTLPSWLNQMAEEENINFSAVLQNALKDKLNII